jgi:hypothetical protein
MWVPPVLWRLAETSVKSIAACRLFRSAYIFSWSALGEVWKQISLVIHSNAVRRRGTRRLHPASEPKTAHESLCDLVSGRFGTIRDVDGHAVD